MLDDTTNGSDDIEKHFVKYIEIMDKRMEIVNKRLEFIVDDLISNDKRALEHLSRLEGRIDVLRDDLRETKLHLSSLDSMMKVTMAILVITATAFCVHVISMLYNGY